MKVYGTTSHELSDQEYSVLSDEAAILAVAEAAQEKVFRPLTYAKN